MSTNTKQIFAWLILGAVVVSCKKETSPAVSEQEQENVVVSAKQVPTVTVSTFATGFNNPRGLEFGPDGDLYVAEAGIGGATSSAGFNCPQADAPFFGSTTGGRISKVNAAGQRTTVTTMLATTRSSSTNAILGPSDVAFVGNTLYALVNGGCSHGVPTAPAGVYRINSSGPPTLLANLSAWQAANPVANPATADFEPDGSWYSMINVGNELFALDANHGELVRVETNGSVSRVVDLSASQGHYVPTAIDYKGNFYIGNLGTFPISGESKIVKVTPSGNVHVDETGFSAVLGLVIDKSLTYVLEMTTGAPFPTPGTGRITVVLPNGNKQVLVSGLNLPTGMTQGPDGNLYVSQWGFGKPPGGGEVLKVTLN